MNNKISSRKSQIANFFIILGIFLVWRAVDFLIIYFIPKFIPYLGFFPYTDQLAQMRLPSWISPLANFDGMHYILIAKNGYAQYEQAFFPFYSLSIRYLKIIFNNPLVAGAIISNVSFLIGLILISYSQSKKGLLWLVVLLITFPTSFFFGSIYTEGLFFLLIVGSLYFLKKERYAFACLFASLASLTRLMGIFLFIPFFFHLFKKEKSKMPLIIFPFVGFFIYAFYLFRTTGDPLYFLTSQPMFGAHRSTHLIILPQVYWRYVKIFITANHDFRYFISVVEFFIFNFVSIVLVLDFIKIIKTKSVDFDRLALNIFSFINILLPTLTGTLSSVPRYALLSISFFIYLYEIKNKWIKISIIVFFLIFHVLLLGFFTQGYFVS